MRKLYYRILILIVSFFVFFNFERTFSQSYTMTNGNFTACSGTFYDSGGASGNYGNSENFTLTFCSSTPGYRISFNFSSFNTESSFEHLKIYDGPNASSTLIGDYTGTASPGVVTSTGTCLTFVFTSDGSVNYTGWAAAISCLAPLPGTNMGNLGTISTCGAIFYDSGGSSANYSDNENYTVTFCSSIPNNQIKIVFSLFNTQAGNDILTVYNGANTTSPILGTYSGTTLPPTLMSTNGCLTFVFTSNSSTNSVGWQANISCQTPPPPTSCGGADGFCTGTTYNFPSGVNSGTAEVGANYGCLGSQPNPVWYFLKIQNPGDISIEMHTIPQHDIDFACWGPFADPNSPCVAMLTAGSGLSSHHAPGPSPIYPSLNMIDCSYDASWQEWCYIPNAIAGQYYLLMITNFSNQPCNIEFSQISGNATTDCSVVAPPITNNGPLCVGQTLQFTVANPTPNAVYHWSGPNGFSSTQMNPSIPNVTTSNAGTYSMIITVNGSNSQPVTSTVVINPNPVISVSPALDTLCLGTSTTITATSTVAGTTFLWMPGSLNSNSITVSPTTNTIYSVTGTAAGCIGNSTSSVLVNPVPVIVGTATPNAICAGTSSTLSATSTVANTSFTWMPGNLTGSSLLVSPTNSTIYTVTGIASGCVSTDTSSLTIKPNPVISVQLTPNVICNGDTIMLLATSSVPNTTLIWMPGSMAGGPLYLTPSASTTYSVTGTINGCVGSNTANVTVNPNPIISASASLYELCLGGSTNLSVTSTVPGTSYSWTPGNQTTSSFTDNPDTTTLYSVIGSISGCADTTNLTVVVNHNPVISAVASKDTLCVGETTNLSALSDIPGTTFSWMPGGLSGASVSVSPIITTTFTLTGTSPNNCTSTTTIQIIVHNNPIVSILSNPTFICLDDTAILTGTGADNYSWEPGTFLGASYTINPTLTTVYTVTGTSINGCKGTASYTLSVYPHPVISAIANPAVICQGFSSTLSGYGAINFQWQPVNLTGNTINVSPSSFTTYSVTGTDSHGCIDTSTVSVNVIPIPPIEIISSPMNGCSPLSVDFNYVISEAINDSSLHWSFGDVNSDTNYSFIANPSHVFDQGGNYIVNLNAMTVNNCPVHDADTIHVTYHPSADFYFTPEFAYSDNPVINFKDESIHTSSWMWDFGDYLNMASNSSILRNPVHEYSDTGYFQVKMIASNGDCRDTAEKWVHIYLADLLFMPNAFTPDGDGVNDIFTPIISGVESSDYYFVVLDRWGKIMFESTTLNQGWDGKFNGKYLTPGVFVYYVKYKEIEGLKREKKGYVTLVR